MKTNLDIHAGDSVTVHRVNRTVWLNIPLSTDGTASVNVFLDPYYVQQLALAFTAMAMTLDRIAQAEVI